MSGKAQGYCSFGRRRKAYYARSFDESEKVHKGSYLFTHAYIWRHVIVCTTYSIAFSSPQKLEKSDEENVNELNQLTKKQTFLKWRCEQLSLGVQDNMTKRRSVSESSSSTFSSTNSQELLRTSSLSEFGESDSSSLNHCSFLLETYC